MQEAAKKEAEKKKLKYKRYKPGQLVLKEMKYYKKRPGFIILISAIRRLFLEIGYNYKQGINFQLHAYKVLQEAAEWYLVRMFKDTNLLAAHAKRITVKIKDLILVRKLSGVYGLYNTWVWNSKNLYRPWSGKIDKEKKKIRRHYLGNKAEYIKQPWKVKVAK